MLELGCGAGHIGLAAAVLSGSHVVQVDRDPAACRWARVNAATNGCAELVEQRCGLAENVLGLAERFAVVIADPPYVPSDEVHLHPDDLAGAIDGGPDGLGAIRSFVRAVSDHLDPDGSIVLQVRGLRQVAHVEGWLAHPSSPALVVAEARSYGETRALARIEVTPGIARRPAVAQDQNKPSRGADR